MTTYLRRGKKLQLGQMNEDMNETALQTTRLAKKAEEEFLQHWHRDSPAACDGQHDEAICPPASLGSPWRSRYPPAAHRGSHAAAGGRVLKEAVTP